VLETDLLWGQKVKGQDQAQKQCRSGMLHLVSADFFWLFIL